MHKKVARRIKINPQYWKQWKLKQTLYFKKKYFSNGYITHFLLYNMFPEFLINWFCINTGITFVKSCVHQASMVRICFSITWAGVISWPGDCSLFHFMELLLPWTWIESRFNLSCEAFGITNYVCIPKVRVIETCHCWLFHCFLVLCISHEVQIFLQSLLNLSRHRRFGVQFWTA